MLAANLGLYGYGLSSYGPYSYAQIARRPLDSLQIAKDTFRLSKTEQVPSPLRVCLWGPHSGQGAPGRMFPEMLWPI